MRFKYLDALRGFTMFLVVFWHVLALSFGLGEESILGDILGRFRMPLFFFISGFIGYKNIDKFNITYFRDSISRKAFVQLVPTLIIYSFFLLSFGKNPLTIFQQGLKGYWFTLVLFELYVFYYVTSYLLKTIGIIKLQDYIYILAIPFFWMIFMGLSYLTKTGVVLPNILTILCIGNFCQYLPFFVFGLLIRKHENSILPIITNKYIFTIAFVIFAIGFLLKEIFFTKDYYQIIYYVLDTLVLRFSGLIFVFGVFYHSADIINNDGPISKVMQYVGKHTLDIYLLHYFFLPDLSNYDKFFFNNGKEFFIGEIFIMGFGIAIPIIAICLLVSYALRKSPILEKYLFGILPKKDN